MKILVAVKRVIDPYVKVRVKSDQSGVETQNVKMAMNPFDEIAVEEALKLRESGVASEVVLVSIGQQTCQETLRHGMALGADRSILVRTDNVFSSLNIAKILYHVANKENPGLILLGKQSIDGDNNQTPQMLAALLDWPQATYVSKLSFDAAQNNETFEATREIDGGLETLKLHLPAVVSTDLRLNEPRYASLPNIMKAKHKPLEIIELDTLNLSLEKHLDILSVANPPARNPGIIVDSVESLVDKLRHEAKVL